MEVDPNAPPADMEEQDNIKFSGDFKKDNEFELRLKHKLVLFKQLVLGLV